MARKQRHQEHENHERWMVSYADFMTLLFALFVVLYAVSRVDGKKVQAVTQSVRWATHFDGTGGTGALPIFDGPVASGGGPALTGGSAQPHTARERAVEQLRRALERRSSAFLATRPGPSPVVVAVEGRRLTVRLAATEFFDPGDAALRPQALGVLDAIAAELVPLGRLIRVEGHTDEAPPDEGRWRNNWDLSAARAVTVVSFLEAAHQARPDRLAATGWGASRPVATNADPEGRAANRRVELVLELDPDEEIPPAGR